MTTRKAETGAGVRVSELPDDLLVEAAGVLTRSFLTNPNFVNLFPDEEVRARALPHVQRACLRDALRAGHVYMASRGGEILAVARQALAVHVRPGEAAPRAAALVPRGGGRRARRAGVGDRHASPRTRPRQGR